MGGGGKGFRETLFSNNLPGMFHALFWIIIIIRYVSIDYSNNLVFGHFFFSLSAAPPFLHFSNDDDLKQTISRSLQKKKKKMMALVGNSCALFPKFCAEVI